MDVLGHINCIANSPLYETEKPYGVTLPADYEPPEDVRLTNLHMDEHLVNIVDMRRSLTEFTLDTAGFVLLQQPTAYPEIDDMEAFEAYKVETKTILQDLLKAELVVCWNARVSGTSSVDGPPHQSNAVDGCVDSQGRTTTAKH